ncbi:MAG: 1,4-dihydroxy-2-naphthoate polyprenyltransferase [Proteobacteria bacterium]|nr:1,4-dihydroxy-2-naphthoate polyprenyltransferase [Pseudomonadota bacterium]
MSLPGSSLGSAGSSPGPSGWRLWWLAARPRTFGAAISPVLVGSGLAAAAGAAHWPSALAALLAALLLQIGANLANDYSDWRRGADTAARLGPPRVTQQGWVAPRRVMLAAALVFAAAAVVGSYLVWRGGWPIVAIGLAGILCGLTYTGGPLPFGYLGLGDLVVALFFGPVAVGGTALVQAQRWLPGLGWAAIGPGALCTAILVVNNLRDRQTDAQAGKRTLAVRWGARACRLEYALLLALAFLAPPVAVALDRLPPGVLWVGLAAPAALLELRRVSRRDGAALNPSLGGTARLALLYGALFALGAQW